MYEVNSLLFELLNNPFAVFSSRSFFYLQERHIGMLTSNHLIVYNPGGYSLSITGCIDHN